MVNKGLDVAQNIRGFTLTKAAGIKIAATFMLGLPTETPEQSEKCIRFALDHDINYAIFGITEQFPGTELWGDAQKYGRFYSSGKYRNALLSENAAVRIPNGRNREGLKALIEKAMWKFYIRPKVIWHMLMNFYMLPLPRAFRFLWAGVVFFIGGRLNRSHLAQRN